MCLRPQPLTTEFPECVKSFMGASYLLVAKPPEALAGSNKVKAVVKG